MDTTDPTRLLWSNPLPPAVRHDRPARTRGHLNGQEFTVTFDRVAAVASDADTIEMQMLAAALSWLGVIRCRPRTVRRVSRRWATTRDPYPPAVFKRQVTDEEFLVAVLDLSGVRGHEARDAAIKSGLVPASILTRFT